MIATNGLAKPTDEATYRKIWNKNVTGNFLPKPKVGCICIATAELGALLYISGDETTAYCAIPQFNPDGTVNSFLGCQSNYVVLPK